MIQFFRKIRRRLLTNNNFSKYLIYAIGEIVLVVIGILIALQINNWNEERKERHLEQQMLHQLKEEFQSNLTQLDTKISIRKHIIERATLALSFIDEPRPIAKDSLFNILTPMVLAPTFDPIKNELLNSDKLQLIRNDSLRKHLSNWPSDVVQLKEAEDEWGRIYQNIITPFLIDFGLSRDISISFYKIDENLSYLMDKKLVQDLNLIASKNTPTIASILTNRKLENILANAVLQNIGINWESAALRMRVTKIQELIEESIQ